MTEEVTVVVPAYGGADRLMILLGALADQARAKAIRQPVILSDDGSQRPLSDDVDRSALVELDLTIARSERNGGPAAARNFGLAGVTTSWTAFLDADMVPGPDWLAHVYALVQQDDGVDVIHGPVGQARAERPTPFTHAPEATGHEMLGGNLVCRTSVLRRMGGFDERFYEPDSGIHFREDTDLQLRLEAAGVRTEFDPRLLVYHPPHDRSLSRPLRLARRYRLDALVSRKHPAAFQRLMRRRRVGPISFRRARHLAAQTLVVGTIAAVAGAATGRSGVALVGVVVGAAGWGATAVALAWKRRIAAGDLLPLAAVSALVPWVYLWHYYRGVLRYRHLARL